SKHLREVNSINKEIESLTEQLNARSQSSNVDENEKKAISNTKRVFLLSQICANEKAFLQRAKELVEGYSFPISLSISHSQNHPLIDFVKQTQEIYRSHTMLNELIDKRLKSYNENLKFGDILTKFVDFLSSHTRFSKNYEKTLQY